MDNKGDKTFTDLFSNSNKENKSLECTFADIFNSSIINDIAKEESEESKELPLSDLNDNLFEKNSTNESSNDIKNLNANIETAGEVFDIFSKENDLVDESDKNETIDKQLNDNNENDIFSRSYVESKSNNNFEFDQIDSNEEIFLNSIENKEDASSTVEEVNEYKNLISEDANISSEANDIFSNGETTESVGNIFDNSSVNVFETEENHTIEKNINDNPFLFGGADSFENKKEFSKDSNFNKTTTNNLEMNPFINDIDINLDKQSNDSSNDNPFFVEKNIDTSEKIIENPFLNSTDDIPKDSDISTNNVIKNGDSSEGLINNNSSPFFVEKSSISKNDEPPKNTSPFFEEEESSEGNPFFQNQINLIENYTPSTSNTNIDTAKSKHYSVKVVKKKEPLLKSIVGVLSYALFIWLLLIGVTLLIYVLDIKIRAAKGDYSSPTFNAYVVLTGSMLPEIKVKDVVVTKKVEPSELKEGDVITFSSADSRYLGTIITHRIIKKNPPTDKEGYTFQTKGDNNNVADNALVPENNIYGKVILKIPKLGYLQEFLASRGGWIIVILIPCLTVMSYDSVKLIKGIKKKKYKNIKVQK